MSCKASIVVGMSASAYVAQGVAHPPAPIPPIPPTCPDIPNLLVTFNHWDDSDNYFGPPSPPDYQLAWQTTGSGSGTGYPNCSYGMNELSTTPSSADPGYLNLILQYNSGAGNWELIIQGFAGWVAPIPILTLTSTGPSGSSPVGTYTDVSGTLLGTYPYDFVPYTLNITGITVT